MNVWIQWIQRGENAELELDCVYATLERAMTPKAVLWDEREPRHWEQVRRDLWKRQTHPNLIFILERTELIAD